VTESSSRRVCAYQRNIQAISVSDFAFHCLSTGTTSGRGICISHSMAASAVLTIGIFAAILTHIQKSTRLVPTKLGFAHRIYFWTKRACWNAGAQINGFGCVVRFNTKADGFPGFATDFTATINILIRHKGAGPRKAIIIFCT